MFKAIRKIHFVGIGGISMSGIAEILLNMGYEVSGSDIKSSALTERLAALGVTVHIGHNASHVVGADVVVFSSAVSRHNPELQEAQIRRTPVVHRSEMLAEINRLKYGVLVAGTHGKTTTTSFLATALSDAGLDPTAIIGGKVNSFGSNAKLGKGDLFVCEADESDGSFLHLSPTIAVITNIDRDHMENYKNLDEIIDTFRKFIEKVPFYGAVCLCLDDPMAQVLIPDIRRKLITFGLRKDADISAENIQPGLAETHFDVCLFGKKGPHVVLKMPGKYNVQNALASFAVGHLLDVNPEAIAKSLSQFEGVLHRFTVLGQTKGITVVDDYAHNPKKISTVLKSCREICPNRNIVAIFQPHRYSRLKHQGDEFAKSFSDVDSVIVTPVYAASETPIPGLDHTWMSTQILQHSFHRSQGSVVAVDSLNAAAQEALKLVQKSSEESLVITLGAGDVQAVGKTLLGLLG